MYIRHLAFLGLGAIAAVWGNAAGATAAADPADWSEPAKPFHIAGPIYDVGSKGLAAYLIVSPQGAILLDGTLAENVPGIEHNIESLGVPLRTVRILLNNHAHYDHAAGLAQIKRDTGARLLASAADRQALEHGTPRGDTDYGVRRFPAVKVDDVVGDDQTIHLGPLALTAHLTPGHTPGCTSWSMTIDDRGTPREVLFLCSITVAGNLLVANHAYPRIVPEFRATFAKLATMHADIVLTGHPEMVKLYEHKAQADAGKPDAFVDRGALPALVASSRAEFEAELAKARTMNRRHARAKGST